MVDYWDGGCAGQNEIGVKGMGKEWCILGDRGGLGSLGGRRRRRGKGQDGSGETLRYDCAAIDASRTRWMPERAGVGENILNGGLSVSYSSPHGSKS